MEKNITIVKNAPFTFLIATFSCKVTTESREFQHLLVIFLFKLLKLRILVTVIAPIQDKTIL